MSNEILTPVEPANPIAPYLGGKIRLAKLLCARINDVEHKLYAEVFVGMGGVFLRRSFRPKAEVINDFSNDVSNLFRILQRHYQQFLDEIRFKLTTRHEFNRLAQTDPNTLTDLERAARFLYLQRTAFGGKVNGRHFGVAPDRPARFDIQRIEPMLEDIYVRLSGVVIENLDFRDFIKRYDRVETLFYLDPPYHGNEKDYGDDMFYRNDFEVLADMLKRIKGRFIMSINDKPEIRQTFAAFDIEPVTLNYSISKQKSVEARELIISN